ncbi:hypothetical protein Bcep1808_7344 (plasmid) [Burkholderia vietnamiensis G4]|uniref:Uncharacterized protein n=1 Tax=Burkholderia vietnamiensis (strain G4 / LMG 22486) TaxID=269482 RepID=A4JVB8_BURVG|nr:hypothetical protein Bcep1808_7344 [Burkholderia vietnamiensis G4]
MVIARDHARVVPPDVDDKTYWEREIRAYDDAFAAYSPSSIPDDFRTHHSAWREGLVIARDRALLQPPEINDRLYWEHELTAYDRAFAAIGIEFVNDLPAWTSEDCAIADVQGWNIFDVDGTGYLEIQKDDEAQVFESDDDAVAYVRERAQGGCPVALKAMKIAELVAQSAGIVGRRLPSVSLEASTAGKDNAPTVTLADGYDGRMVRFGANPIEVDGELVKLRCEEPGKEYMTAWRSADVLRDAIDSQEEARNANRDWIREVARNVLKQYAGVDRVSNLYDSDEKFSAALRDLAGTDFEYPDFSHLSVADAMRKAIRLGSMTPTSEASLKNTVANDSGTRRDKANFEPHIEQFRGGLLRVHTSESHADFLIPEGVTDRKDHLMEAARLARIESESLQRRANEMAERARCAVVAAGLCEPPVAQPEQSPSLGM